MYLLYIYIYMHMYTRFALYIVLSVSQEFIHFFAVLRPGNLGCCAASVMGKSCWIASCVSLGKLNVWGLLGFADTLFAYLPFLCLNMCLKNHVFFAQDYACRYQGLKTWAAVLRRLLMTSEDFCHRSFQELLIEEERPRFLRGLDGTK